MNVLITSNPLIDQQFLETEEKLIYHIVINDFVKEKEINLKSKRYKYINDEFKYAIIEIIDEDLISNFIEAEENIIHNDEFKEKSVFSVQYPKGNKLKFSTGTIVNTSIKKII